MTIDAAEIARLRKSQKAGHPALWSTILALLDELEKARERIEAMRQANAGMAAERDAAKGELEKARAKYDALDRTSEAELAACEKERDAAHALLRIAADHVPMSQLTLRASIDSILGDA